MLDPYVEKGEKKPAERQLMREASMLLYEHLKKNGKLYNCGNVARWRPFRTHVTGLRDTASGTVHRVVWQSRARWWLTEGCA